MYYFDQKTQAIETVKGSKKAIGGVIMGRLKQKENVQFENSVLTLNDGDILYLTTDGLVDQANPNRKKFGTTYLLEWLTNHAKLPLEEQRELLTKALQDHQQTAEQRDDITFIGVKA